MKKINWKILNAACWIELLLSYVLPFTVINDFQYQVGFPIAFLSVYDTKIGINPFMSMSLNPIAFLLNSIIIYVIIMVILRVLPKR